MENPKGASPGENQQDEALMEISSESTFQSLSEYINTEIHPAILHAIILLIPVNIYVIGDRLGAGIQWPLFRYQETYLGGSLITIFSDAGYVIQGIIYGKTAFSIVLWILGAILLTMAFLMSLFPEKSYSTRFRGFALIFGALLFLLSSFVQYGLLFHGPAGITIPIGIPVLLFLGVVLLKTGSATPLEEGP